MNNLVIQINLKDDRWSLEEAIINVIAYFTRHDASNGIQLKYEEENKELIVTCNNLNQSNFNSNVMNAELEHSLWIILSKKISITVKTPTILFEIKNKDLSNSFEKDLGVDVKLTNINEFQQGAKLVLKPIEKDIIAPIKANFVGLQHWQISFKTKYGELLINQDEHAINYVYINGIKMQTCNDLIDKIPERNFTYSYNLTDNGNEELKAKFSSYFFVDHFFPKLIHPLIFEKYIALILDNINDDNKENVYLNIINNVNSFEWDIPQVKKLIVNFFTKVNPETYLITTKSNENSIQCKLAKNNNKEIIVLPPNIFYELKDKKFLTANEWAKQYYIDCLNKQVTPSELDFIGKRNWEEVQLFCQSLVNNNQKLKEYLASINYQNIPLIIIENLPVETIWLEKIHQIWVKKSIINNLTDFLSALFHAIWRLMPEGVVYDEFIKSWTNLLIKFSNQKLFNQSEYKSTKNINENGPTINIKSSKDNYQLTCSSSLNNLMDKTLKAKTKISGNTNHAKAKEKTKIVKRKKFKAVESSKKNAIKHPAKSTSKNISKIKTNNNPTTKITFSSNNDLIPNKRKYYLNDVANLQFPYTLPIYYRIGNEGWNVKSWKDVLQITYMYLYHHHYHDSLIKYLKQKDIYLGKYKRTLGSPRCIPNTDFWFATNYKTPTIINVCRDAFHYFKDPLNKIYFIIK